MGDISEVYSIRLPADVKKALLTLGAETTRAIICNAVGNMNNRQMDALVAIQVAEAALLRMMEAQHEN